MSVLVARCSYRYNILYGVVVEVVEFFSLFGSKRVRKVEHKLLKGDHSENNQSSYPPPPHQPLRKMSYLVLREVLRRSEGVGEYLTYSICIVNFQK